jgi:hypothetical protein
LRKRKATYHLTIKHNEAAAEQAHAADRFAREIIGILTVFAARLRRLMGRPLGGARANVVSLTDASID